MPTFFVILALLVSGIAAGILVNLLADSLPYNHSPLNVQCTTCGSHFSCANYLFFLKCETCGRGSGKRRWVIQLGLPIGFLLLWLFPPRNLSPVLAMVILTYMLVVFVIDLEHKEVITLTSLVGLILAIMTGFIYRGVGDTLLGGAVGLGVMLIFYWLGKVFIALLSRLRGERIEEVALGLGDVHISFILGLFVGWPMILFLLMLAILAGGLVSASIILIQRLRKTYQPLSAIPYTPFLLIAGAVLLYLIKPGA